MGTDPYQERSKARTADPALIERLTNFVQDMRAASGTRTAGNWNRRRRRNSSRRGSRRSGAAKVKAEASYPGLFSYSPECVEG
jgi:hypothetical protein